MVRLGQNAVRVCGTFSLREFGGSGRMGEDGRERKMDNTVPQFCGVAKNKSVTKKERSVSPRERESQCMFFVYFSFMTQPSRTWFTQKKVVQ